MESSHKHPSSHSSPSSSKPLKNNAKSTKNTKNAQESARVLQSDATGFTSVEAKRSSALISGSAQRRRVSDSVERHPYLEAAAAVSQSLSLDSQTQIADRSSQFADRSSLRRMDKIPDRRLDLRIDPATHTSAVASGADIAQQALHMSHSHKPHSDGSHHHSHHPHTDITTTSHTSQQHQQQQHKPVSDQSLTHSVTSQQQIMTSQQLLSSQQQLLASQQHTLMTSHLTPDAVESWLNQHPEFAQNYFSRRATRTMVDDWLINHHKSTSPDSIRSDVSTRSSDVRSDVSASSSGANTPARKISAQEFERDGQILKPMVSTVDGQVGDWYFIYLFLKWLIQKEFIKKVKTLGNLEEKSRLAKQNSNFQRQNSGTLEKLPRQNSR